MISVIIIADAGWGCRRAARKKKAARAALQLVDRQCLKFSPGIVFQYLKLKLWA
tara:strand:- start:383 stop:544 length:162 start_codon:yes stop_codon:yes gene_type:complete